MSDVGDLKTIAITFRDEDGTPTDPTTVMLVLTDPVGTATTFTFGVDAGLIKDSTGVYHMDYTPTIAGRFLVRWIGSGVIDVVEPYSFLVSTSWRVGTTFTYSPANVDDPISQFRLDLGDTDENDILFTDDEIQAFVTRAGTGTAALGLAYRSLANRYAHLASFAIGGLRVEYAARAILWGKKADMAEGDTVTPVGPAIAAGTVPMTSQPYFHSDLHDSLYTGKEVPIVDAPV